MEQLSKQQLNARIDAFISRKDKEFPELALRGNEKKAESIGFVLADKISDFISNARIVRLAH